MKDWNSASNYIYLGNEASSIIHDKPRLVRQYILYMLSRTQEIFKYGNLPDTIPHREIERLLQTRGNAIIAKAKDKLWALFGGLGGAPEPYNRPKFAGVANVGLNLSKQFNIHYEYDKKFDENTDCIVIRNDMCYQGLLPMFEKSARLLADIDISIWYASINARIPSMPYSDNDTTKKSLDKVFEDIVEGKKYGIIVTGQLMRDEQSFDTKIFSQQTGSTHIMELIELRNYILANWYIELGLNANYNMKREAINEAESTMNDDCLMPLIDQMLTCRKEGIEQVNKAFGTNITVELSSSWKEIRKENELFMEQQEAQIEGAGENEPDNQTDDTQPTE